MKSDMQMQNEPQLTSMSMLFVRLAWAIVGPGAMFVTLLKIAEGGTGWTTVLDLVFFVFLALTVAARWFDYFYGVGRTMSGDIATPVSMRRYTAIVCALGLLAWIVGNVLGNHVLR